VLNVLWLELAIVMVVKWVETGGVTVVDIEVLCTVLELDVMWVELGKELVVIVVRCVELGSATVVDVYLLELL